MLTVMLRNYLTVAFRNLRRHLGYTAINVLGLAVGMAACLALLLYVYDELSYDRFHEQSDRLFRVVTDLVDEDGTVNHSAYSFSALGPTMLRGMSNVEAAARVKISTSSLIRVGDEPFGNERVLVADSSFFDLFSYRFLQGDPATALDRPSTVVLTRSTAERYFGDENPIGRAINLDNREDLEVTAVVEEPPANTHLRFDVLSTLETMNAERPGRLDSDWRILYGYTYVLLSDEAHAEAVEAGLPALTQPYLQPFSESWGGSVRFDLQPVTSIHLRSHRDHEIEPGGDIVYVYVLTTIAVLILLIACINFVSLSTAQAAERAREVGVRKVFGASRAQLIRQFLVESTVFATAAVAVALGLFMLCLPAFNQLSGKAFTAHVLGSFAVPVGFAAVALIVGVVGGSYPAFVLSAFRPALVLKGKKRQGRAGARMRKGLVVAEFSGVVVLMICAIVIHQQLAYMKNAELGFDGTRVVVVQHVFAGTDAAQMQTIKQELLRGPAVQGVTLASEWPTRPAEGQLPFRAEGMSVENGLQMAWYQVDEDYLRMLDMELAAGRNFSPELASDSAAFLINQTAARQFGLAEDEAVGTHILAPDSDEERGAIIGVVKDFHTNSLHDWVEPVVFVHYWARPRNILLKIDGRDVSGALAHIEETWARHFPDYPLNYAFLDQQYDALYRAEERLSRVVKTFTGLAILVACLGLFALATFTAQQRTREIGIRKVLGASVPGIVALLSNEFIRLVLAAFVIATPIGYVAMRRWLQDFAYRINLSIGVFLLAGALALAIAFLTVSYQAIRAARTDPAKAIRYE